MHVSRDVIMPVSRDVICLFLVSYRYVRCEENLRNTNNSYSRLYRHFKGGRARAGAGN